MSAAVIEVETKSVVTPERYRELLAYFQGHARLLGHDTQETHYFDCPQDLRLQKSDSGAKIVLKKGMMHADAREEIEVPIAVADFEKTQQLIEGLGMQVEIVWLRERYLFEWDGVDVTVDSTQGYGYIIELELRCQEGEEAGKLSVLKDRLEVLGLEQTSTEEFSRMFATYKKEWRKLIDWK